MTTDNKTLADVQPGGMVRLVDQAERARFEAWAEDRELGTAKCSADGMKGDYADLSTDWCWAAWQAALSAQPSPGGQGDAREQFSDWWADQSTAIGEMLPYEIARLGWQAALTARQPVYEGHTWVSDYVLAGLRERAALPLQLRNGDVWHWQGDGYDFPDSLVCPVVMSAETLRELIAARQPVGEQHPDDVAVDLGQFRPAVELMEWQERGHASPDFPVGDPKKHAEALRLLALIDSQAVGK